MAFIDLIKYLDSNSKVVEKEEYLGDRDYIIHTAKIIRSDKVDEASKLISRYIMDKMALRAKYIKERNKEDLDDANAKIHTLLNYEFEFKE